MSTRFPDHHVAVLAPYPGEDRFMDGWMSRIKTIDLALSSYKRVYLDFQDWYPETSEPEIVFASEKVKALRLSPGGGEHRKIVGNILKAAKFIYIHTMHQCEYALQYFDPDKMVVDIHGVVPEEEAMMGSAERSEKYERIEAEIFRYLKTAFVVTRAMARHFEKKHPASSAQLIHLPVYDFDAASGVRLKLDELYHLRSGNEKDRGIYAGGAQIWQCVDQMLDLMKVNQDIHKFAIFSHDEAMFADLIRIHGLSPDIFKGYVGKEKLKEVYDQSNFGFVLRSNNIVNRVASPTKICDYCAAAVIPIVDFSAIGDFEEYGYAYVRAEDYREGYIPDLGTQLWMADRNLDCMEEMKSEFQAAIAKLQKQIDEHL